MFGTGLNWRTSTSIILSPVHGWFNQYANLGQSLCWAQAELVVARRYYPFAIQILRRENRGALRLARVPLPGLSMISGQ